MSSFRSALRTSDTEDLIAKLRGAGSEFTACSVINLSLSGMFVSGERLPNGDRVAFELAGGEFWVEGVAEVVHRTEEGLGLRFLEIEGPGKQAIEDLVIARALRERSLSEPLPGVYLG